MVKQYPQKCDEIFDLQFQRLVSEQTRKRKNELKFMRNDFLKKSNIFLQKQANKTEGVFKTCVSAEFI